VILAAAQDVFLRDPRAPISAVADAAGVGISALYRRYPSKDDLLRTLCADGLRRHLEVAERALAPGLDPWDAFAGFLADIVDADVHALTVHLAGMFTPTAELRELAAQVNVLTERVVRRTLRAKAVRRDFDVNDLPMLLEQVSAIRASDPERTATLRRRYLAVVLDGLRPGAATSELPGPAPSDTELGERWATS
jgi:AcrR family transcriptional regulator